MVVGFESGFYAQTGLFKVQVLTYIIAYLYTKVKALERYLLPIRPMGDILRFGGLRAKNPLKIHVFGTLPLNSVNKLGKTDI
jgi:hypothetical protein